MTDMPPPPPRRPLPRTDVLDVEPPCPECKREGTVVLDPRKGAKICTSCGLVVDDKIIAEGTEWRNFSDDKGEKGGADPNRIGGPEDLLLGDSQLITYIGGPGYGKFNKGVMSSAERSLMAAFSEIAHLCSRLELPRNITDRAKETFKRVHDSKQLRGRSVQTIIVACVYIACRQANVDRTLKELCAVVGVKRKDVGRCFAKIKQAKLYKRAAGVSMGSTDAHNTAGKLMPRLCNLLNLPLSIADAAAFIADKTTKLTLGMGRQPSTIAGAAIFLACQLHPDQNHRRTFEEIGQVTMMASSTIRQAYRDLYERRSELVPPDYVSSEAVLALAYLRTGPTDARDNGQSSQAAPMKTE